MSRAQEIGRVGEWTFYRDDAHGFGGSMTGVPLFGFTVSVPEGTAAGKPRITEWHQSLEHAMAAAIAEKYTGSRGAGGTGVGTAADWFMRMIGANRPTRAEVIERAMETEAVQNLAVKALTTRTRVAEVTVDALGLDLRP